MQLIRRRKTARRLAERKIRAVLDGFRGDVADAKDGDDLEHRLRGPLERAHNEYLRQVIPERRTERIFEETLSAAIEDALGARRRGDPKKRAIAPVAVPDEDERRIEVVESDGYRGATTREVRKVAKREPPKPPEDFDPEPPLSERSQKRSDSNFGFVALIVYAAGIVGSFMYCFVHYGPTTQAWKTFWLVALFLTMTWGIIPAIQLKPEWFNRDD